MGHVKNNYFEMFKYSIDDKDVFTDIDGNEVVDLSNSIFTEDKRLPNIYAVLKVRKEYEMRPDLVSKVLYGTTDNTELLLKYSLIQNPFSLEKDDVIFNVSNTEITRYIKTEKVTANTGIFDAIKNRRRYIDPKAVPSVTASEKNNINTTQYKEPNISDTGETGVYLQDGKIYFGAKPENKTNTQEVESNTSISSTSGTIYSIGGNMQIKDNSIVFDIDDIISEYIPEEYTENANNMVVKNGKVYFKTDAALESGDTTLDEGIISVVSDIECAKSGMSLGSFLNVALNNKC